MKRIWVDGSLKVICWVVEGEEPCIQEQMMERTTNECEYLAVLWALGREGGRFSDIEILSDSQLVVRQLNGEYKIKEPRLLDLARAINMIVTWHGLNVKFTWVSRWENLAGLYLDKKGRNR